VALLREFGPCSRADLVRATGLSAPTITNVVNDLLDKNLIEPLGEGESSGGRRPDMFRFKAERGCVAGVEITAEHIAVLLADLNGIELETMKVQLAQHKTTPDAICGSIQKSLLRLLRKQKRTPEQLSLLVVGVPAIANVDEGTVLSITTLEGWRAVPLRAMLNKYFDCLVIIENDTNLAAQGEHFCGAAQAEQDFVYVSIGRNVGAGILLNGHIHHGSRWSAGEIAYLRLPHILRKQPTIHEFGELESVLTCSGILKSWQELSKKRGHAVNGKRSEPSATDVLDLAMVGNPTAQKIVCQRADIVSDIIVNLSLIQNPSLVLLGGEIGSHPALLSAVLQQLKGSEFAITRVGTGTLGGRAALWGAISLALEAIPAVLLPQPEM
jgi:glucokinase